MNKDFTNQLEENKKHVASEFGKRLKLLRRQKDISMEELALTVGSTKSAISRYESGTVAPTLDTARKFAEYFMVTVDWLGGGGEEDEILSSVPQKYIDTIKRAIEGNISPEQLTKAIDFISEIRKH